ncbi:unnamed protein product [Cuscuta campestris]|uniref:Uncharacterized protein n=1 Tax=Cuscuta campestris TaxID=132261 RepID=A0A484K9D6_9ASTE|nr:unnamed protein product [Cuscuta campestris]
MKGYAVGRIPTANSALVVERRRLWHIVPPLHLHLLVEIQGFLSRKMKSRLLDPLEPERMTLKSGCEGEEDKDPFMDEDVPEALTKKINLLNRPLTTLQWVSFIILTAAFFCTFKIHVLRSKIFAGLYLWK